MLVPVTTGAYDFWVNMCPLDTEFNARVAVNQLRSAKTRGVVPWGQIQIDGTPIIDLLVSAALHSRLPSSISKMIHHIKRVNAEADQQRQQRIEMSSVSFAGEQSHA